MTIDQIEVLRQMRDRLGYFLSDAERNALNDVINHFDACIACLEASNERDS